MLEGTVGPDGKSIKAVGDAQLKILRAAREEVNSYPFIYLFRCTFVLCEHTKCSFGLFIPARLARTSRGTPYRARKLRRLPFCPATSSSCGAFKR